ncbi:MAG: hypothetical protein ACTSWL_07130 [Promethearchaeota archaeon]
MTDKNNWKVVLFNMVVAIDSISKKIDEERDFVLNLTQNIRQSVEEITKKIEAERSSMLDLTEKLRLFIYQLKDE